MNNRTFSLLPLTACAVLLASQTHAGGLWLNEYGTSAQGRAGAGAQAGTGDASTIFHNPASMVEIEKPELMVSVGYITPNVEFDVDQGGLANGTGDGGSAAKSSPAASIFYVHPLNDRWSMGVSAVVLSGAELDYAKGWAGRFQVQDVDILVGGLTPGFAYQVTDNFSVGLGGAIMYTDLNMKIAVPNPQGPVTEPDGQASLNGDDIQVAPHVGLHYKLGEHTRVGATYLGRFDFEYDGDFKLNPPGFDVGVNTDLTFADTIRVGLSHEFNDQWRGHLTTGWDNWSQLGDILLSTESGGAVLPRNWEDTYHYAAGMEYDVSRRWSVQGGIAYDTNPVDKNDRTADMPMDRQVRYAFGVEYRRDSGMTINGSFVYADYGDAEIVSAKQPPILGFSGEYADNDIMFFSLAFDFPFGGGSR